MADDLIKIKITFKGDAPGLADHRLSLGAFGPALVQLVAAYRRIASGMLTEALVHTEYGGKGGRYRKEVETLDLEVSQIVDGCTSFDVFCTVRPSSDQHNLFENGFRERAADILLDSIDAESRGELRNAAVRKYLGTLPKGLTGQEYTLRRGGGDVRTVRVGSMQLPETPHSSTVFLDRIEGLVVGVGFAPAPPEVRIRAGNSTVSVKASEEQVISALNMRDVPIVCMVLRGEERLLWIKPADQAVRPSRETVLRHLADRWSGVLERLAQ